MASNDVSSGNKKTGRILQFSDTDNFKVELGKVDLTDLKSFNSQESPKPYNDKTFFTRVKVFTEHLRPIEKSYQHTNIVIPETQEEDQDKMNIIADFQSTDEKISQETLK